MHRKLGAAVASVLMLVSISAVLVGNEGAVVSATESSGGDWNPTENWIDYVNTFIGVGRGMDDPCVGVPFGTTKWDPQGKPETGGTYCPYKGEDAITGFRGTHWQSGSCTRDYASVTIQPQAGVLKTTTDDRNTPMNVKDIEHTPAYWACTLHDDFDLRVEVTATMHSAIFRITYHGSGDAHVLVDAHIWGSTELHANNNEIWALNVQRGHSKHPGIRGYSVVKFSKPFLPSSGVSGNLAHADFNVNSGDTILVKVGLSFIDFDQASANLEAEIPDWNFDQVRGEIREIWNRELSKIEVEGGTHDQKVIFYTALWHALLLPRSISEYGRYYSPFDAQVHTCDGYEFYTDLSLWDTFRAEHPLLSIIEPKVQADVCQTFVNQYKEGGWIAKWPAPGYYAAMIATHSDSVIADTIMKGITDFDIETAYKASLKHATTIRPVFYEAREGIIEYMDLGYVPYEIGEATSRTLEFAYGDWCIAQMAKVLGDWDNYAYFMERAGYWKNVYDPEAPGDPFPGFVRGRYSDGSWAFPGTFDPMRWSMCEATPWHYTWFVPQDVQGLIDMMDGREKFNEKLETFFYNSAIGRFYWTLGNEPTHHTIQLFDYSGMPWRTQYWARWFMANKYMTIRDTEREGGLCGNDDCGAISSWYIFNAMGFFPVCPGSTTYQIGSPIFDRVTIHLPEYHYGGKEFTIIAHNNSAENMYIQSATLNGEPLEKPWFWHSDLANGGTLEFWMGSEPNMEWGSDPEDAPPSMFLPDITPPEPFDLLTPTNGATISDNTPTLTWEASSDAESGLDQYEVWIDGVNVENVATTEYTTAELSEGTYMWYVVAVDMAGNKRPSTSTFSLEITSVEDTTPPLAFDLLIPEDGVTVEITTPTLTWEASSDAESGLDQYEVWIDGSNVDNVPVGTTIYTASPLSTGGHMWYVVAVDGAGNRCQSKSIFTFTVAPPVGPAEFVVENLSITPENVYLGESVTVSVDVVNVGGTEGTTTVELKINGEAVDNEVVTFAPGGFDTVAFTVTEGATGIYDVEVNDLTGSFEVTTMPAQAEFVVENLEVSPENVAPGEEVTISVDVANIGEVAGTKLVELEVDGEAVDNQSVTLASGESDTVTFTVTRDEEGTYEVEVNGLTGSFEVVPPEGVPVWPIVATVIAVIALIGGVIWWRRH